MSRSNVPATKKFIVKKEFVVGKHDIKWIGGYFKKWFSDMVEEPVEETELRQDCLTELSVDGPIIKEWGGRKKVQIFLSQVLKLMNNTLKKDGTMYVAYAETTVFDKDEEHLAYENKKGEKVALRAVFVYWNGGWFMGADTGENPDGWGFGYQIVSRNT